jgi:hypothetical protein
VRFEFLNFFLNFFFFVAVAVVGFAIPRKENSPPSLSSPSHHHHQSPGPGVDAAWAQSKADDLNPPGFRPPFNSEFYTGWLTHWGELMANTSVPVMTRSLEGILALPNRIVPFLVPQSAKAIAATTEAANLALIRSEKGRAGSIGGVNLYMGAGGTNFGFQAGANLAGRAFEPDLTSYDYDCPIGEDGEMEFEFFFFLEFWSRSPEVSRFFSTGKRKKNSLSSPFF